MVNQLQQSIDDDKRKFNELVNNCVYVSQKARRDFLAMDFSKSRKKVP